MVIYEVNLEIDPGVKAQYLSWLSGHIEQILEVEGFFKAELFQVEEQSDWSKYCVQYQIRDRDSLEVYFKEHAPGFREDGLRRFPGQFKATRRVLLRC